MTPIEPPRLESTSDAGTLPGYAPISWTAVASLIVAGLFGVLLLILGWLAYSKSEPLIAPALLAFPALAVVLAFVARRQIRASEGTRVGEKYANTGWWLGVVGGLGYVAYLGAVEFTIRQDADAAFIEFADHLKAWDPESPTDEHLYAAFLMTIDPGVRSGANPKRPETMSRFADRELPAFRQTDLVRLVARNEGQNEFKVQGLQNWQQKPTEISCTLTAKLINPEGEFELVVPMRAMVDDKKKRRWQISPTTEGYVKDRLLTPYGWWMEIVDMSAKQFAADLVQTLSADAGGGQARYAFYAFVQPDLQRSQADFLLAYGVPGIAGGPGALPAEDGWIKYLKEKVFATPGGTMTEQEANRMLFFWTTPGRLSRAGGVLQGNPDVNPVFSVSPTGIEARVPVELAFGTEGPRGSAARGRLVLRCPAESNPKFFADLEAARKAAPNAERTARPPAEVSGNFPRLNWRVVRLESDLKPVQSAPMPGAPPGMPGM